MRTAKSRAHSDARTQETWAKIDQRLKFLRPLKCKWFEQCHILEKLSILVLRATAWWFILENFRSCRKVTKALRWKHCLLGHGGEIHWFLTFLSMLQKLVGETELFHFKLCGDNDTKSLVKMERQCHSLLILKTANSSFLLRFFADGS